MAEQGAPVERRVGADDGVELWTRTAGEGGPVVVCCHGGPGMADYLEPVAASLAGHASVVRWDQRGAGRSGDAGPYSVERFVADLDAVRASTGAASVLLFGHSWGANLALLYAQAHPERVAGLLYCSGTGLEWWPDYSRVHKQRQAERLGHEAGTRLVELRGRDRTDAEDTELRMLYLRSEIADVDDLQLVGRLFGHEVAFPPNLAVNAALNVETRGLAREELVAACARVSCPVLIVHGGLDPRPLDALASLTAALPAAELQVMDQVGHYPWLDDHEGFAELIARWVEGSTSPAGERGEA